MTLSKRITKNVTKCYVRSEEKKPALVIKRYFTLRPLCASRSVINFSRRSLPFARCAIIFSDKLFCLSRARPRFTSSVPFPTPFQRVYETQRTHRSNKYAPRDTVTDPTTALMRAETGLNREQAQNRTRPDAAHVGGFSRISVMCDCRANYRSVGHVVSDCPTSDVPRRHKITPAI